MINRIKTRKPRYVCDFVVNPDDGCIFFTSLNQEATLEDDFWRLTCHLYTFESLEVQIDDDPPEIYFRVFDPQWSRHEPTSLICLIRNVGRRWHMRLFAPIEDKNIILGWEEVPLEHWEILTMHNGLDLFTACNMFSTFFHWHFDLYSAIWRNN